MKQIAVALSVMVLLAVGFGVFFMSSSGTGGAAWADIALSLRAVKTVHMTGDMFYSRQGAVIPLALHKDKWIRREPFTVFEKVTPASPAIAGEARPYIFSGDAAKTYWYFPGSGRGAKAGPGLAGDFMQDVMSPMTGPDASAPKPPLKVAGRARLDGRSVTILTASSGQESIELAMDPHTKLVLRLRQFASLGDRPTEVTRLRFEYNKVAPKGVFGWVPPAGE